MCAFLFLFFNILMLLKVSFYSGSAAADWLCDLTHYYRPFVNYIICKTDICMACSQCDLLFLKQECGSTNKKENNQRDPRTLLQNSNYLNPKTMAALAVTEKFRYDVLLHG